MWRFDQGENSSSARSQLADGELQRSIGTEYRTGDTRLWRHPARTLYGKVFQPGTHGSVVTDRRIDGVYFADFDDLGARLIALSRGTLYSSPVPGEGGFTVLDSTLTDSDKPGFKLSGRVARLFGAHYNDRHYLVNGLDKIRVVEGDGTVRVAGMLSPTTQPQATASSTSGSATLSRPTVDIDETGDWSNEASAYDSDSSTFASASRSSAGTSTIRLKTWASLATVASDQVHVRFAVGGAAIQGADVAPGGTIPGSGGASSDSGFQATVKIRVSEDGGSSFVEALSQPVSTAIGEQIFSYDLDVASNRNQVEVLCDLVYASGGGQASLRIHDVSISDGSTTAVATTSGTGLRYTYTEYDQTRGLESPPGPQTALKTLAAQNLVTLTNPQTTVNPNTTHIRWYRLPDGGVGPFDYGLIGTSVAGAAKVFRDDFSVYGPFDQPGPPLEMIQISVDRGDVQNPIAFFANQAPPKLDFILEYEGSLVGFVGRSEYYSMGGRPESWPEVNFIGAFPMDGNDEIFGAAVVDTSLVVAARGSMIRQEGLPRIVGGIFNSANVVRIAGAPGCVRRGCIVPLSRSGEQVAVWVSQSGVHLTNGFNFQDLTDDIDWSKNVSVDDLENFAILHWDGHRDRMHLRFQYAENRYAVLHMGRDHSKSNGLPKITWGHYGKVSGYAGGMTSGSTYLWSGHQSNGEIYLERDGFVDASNAKGDGTWPLDVSLKRRYQSYNDYMVRKARLRHSDGGNQSMVCTWLTGSDTDDPGQELVVPVSIAGDRGTEFGVIKAGSWHEPSFFLSGGGDVALEFLEVDEEVYGRTGVY